MFKLLSALVLLVLALPVQAQELTARQIMERVNDRDDGDNRVSDMTMLLVDRGGETRSRAIRAFDKDQINAAGGEDRRRIMFFTAPADVKDTGFLTFDYKALDKDDDQWLYLPALRKSKRIASTDKSGSFMGSDFNYSDMVRRNLDAYDYRLVKEEELRGAKVWIIEAVARTPTEREESGYEKSLMFVRQDNFLVVRGVLWTTEGGRIKYLDAPGVEQIDGGWAVTRMTMTTKKSGQTEHHTELTFENVHYNQTLDEEMFTLRRLEKGL